MWTALALFAQAAVFFVDEFYFHRRRGLPKWERWGHPADTLTVIAALSVPAFFSPTDFNLRVFGVLGVLSCVFVTKDEWVHAAKCPPTEHWLHSVLFILHPVVFICVGFEWMGGFSGFPLMGLYFQLAVLVAMALYQVGYWALRA